MIDASEVARKTHSGCEHSVPIVVPCLNCTELLIKTWESHVRNDVKRQLAEELKYMATSRDEAEAKLASIVKSNEKLAGRIAELNRLNNDLRQALKDAQARISEMTIQMHAEQAFLQGRNYKEAVE